MKTSALSKQIFVFALLWSSMSSAANWVYSDLKTKSYDEMNSQITKYVLTAQDLAEDDVEKAKEKLKDALQLIFSRPNSDNMVSQLTPTVRSPLKNLEAYESSVRDIVTASLQTARNSKASVAARATSLVVLENVMSELQPDWKTNPKVAEIFKSIRDAKIEISDDVRGEFRMKGSMKAPTSPSDTAKKIIGAK